jgi:cephalosporin-C deacetylase-like acetyl esterase
MTKWIACLVLVAGTLLAEKETLAPLDGGPAPQTFDALWAGFDPQAEPLEVELLKEWEEDGVVLRALRYRIGVFKGQKAMMAGIYGFPKGGKNLPGLVNIHGGGQYADYRSVLTNAKRGYATITIAWAGRINSPQYKLGPAEVNLFWKNKTEDPNYRITTDWGALDAYHAPCKNPGNAFADVKPQAWTLDEVDSPRNNPWFLCTMGARRALTFLEQQPEVDGSRLGVYGHSMGGKLTVLTTGADRRVKAAAPSCGGLSNRDTGKALFDATIADDKYLQQISCPIMFLSPANDFHGRIDDLQTALTEIQSKEWRVTCAAHHNHQDTKNYEVATQLWFDEHLKGTFSMPKTPVTSLKLNAGNGVSVYAVTPDQSKAVLAVDVFYTQQGQINGLKDDRNNTVSRFWHHAAAEKKGDVWTAELPLSSTDQPLWVYANVLCQLGEPVSGAGYYYREYTTDQFNLSSSMEMVLPKELKEAGVKAVLKPTLVIESFSKDWEKEWFSYRPAAWGVKTHKVYDPCWTAPEGAKLGIEVKSVSANKLAVGIDVFAAEVGLVGGNQWQAVVLAPADFRSASDKALPGWDGIRELRLGAMDQLKEKANGKTKQIEVGGTWTGDAPEFRNLRWIVE